MAWVVAGIFAASSVFGADGSAGLIDSPYRFASRPGNPDWHLLATGGDQYYVCDIDPAIAARMTSRALVATCLDYPLRHYILASNSSHRDGLEMLVQQFSGLKELFTRTNASSVLMAEYQARTSVALTNPKGPNYIEDAYLTALLLREGVIKHMTNEQKDMLLRCSLRLFKIVHDRRGFCADLGIYGRLAMVLLLVHEVPIPLSDLPLSTFATKEGLAFARLDINFIPEKPFLANLLRLAASIE